VATCSRCGEENPAQARFCLGCGAKLAAGPAPDEERKVVSILFVDLVGFTASADRTDPEDVRARLRPYHARLKQEIERFGGTVEKFVGDAVMAAFGAPVTHEDDAERAVRTGFRVLQAIDELNQAEPGLGLSVRAAVNTGEAVVAIGARPAEGEGFVTGDVVNTAARLQQAAPVGTVVVGEQTFQTTKHVIEYEELERISVKGKAEPLAVWLAKSPRGWVGLYVEQRAPTPFVGREHELALLKDTYARTRRESSIQLLTLTGEPGVGKSRLVAELHTLVGDQAESVPWRQGRCLPYGEGITFWALGEIIKAQAGVLESDSSEEASDKLALAVREVVEEASERDWFQDRLAPLVGATSAEAVGAVERSQSFTAWRRFLEAIASNAPALVLVFEDLHWADDAMLEFVEHLVDWSTGVPVLVICTARPELYERRPGWAGGKRNSTTASLSPLSTEETARLIGALLAQAVLPAETQAALLERAGGNPLYAEEFVRMLSDRGALERDGSVIRVAAGAEIPVPETVHALIAARLDTLPPERKSLLHAAAVVGRVFWGGAVASVSGADEPTVEHALHALAKTELVRPARTSSVQGESEYSFWHALIRDVAYGQLPRTARAAKHQAAAEWIERIAGERVIDHAELLAHHYGQALDLARAAGAGDQAQGLEANAKRFLALAGDRALRLDVDKAHSYYRRALELLGPGEPERARVLARTAESAALSGRYSEAEAGYAEAISGLRAQREHLGAGAALVKLGAIVRDRGEPARAKSLLDEAVKLLEQEPPGAELVLAYTHTARYYHFSASLKQAREWEEKAIDTARKLGIEGLATHALAERGGERVELGDLGGLDDLREALRIGLELGLGEDTAAVYAILGDFVWWTEGPAAGLNVYRSGIDFAERRGMTYYTTYLRGESVWPLFELGEWNALLEIARELVEWDRTSYQALLALSYAAHVRLRRGHARDATALGDEFLHRARASGDPQVLVPALATAALIEESRGNAAEAVRLVEELGTFTRGQAMRRAQHLPDAIRVCAAVGATSLAENLLEGIEVVAARHRHAVHAARAVLAETQGQLDQSLTLYEETAERWAEFGFVLEHGYALLGGGRCLLARGDPERAAMRLEKARDIFQSLDARPLVGETESLLERAAALAP
jgi:class 3 adenylate cyclase/tetratricopeptide (TPR) repeat protein